MSLSGDNNVYGKMVTGEVQEPAGSDYIYLKYDNREEKILPSTEELIEETIEQDNIFIESSDREVMEELSAVKENQYFDNVTEETENIEEHYEIKLSDIKEEWNSSFNSSKEIDTTTENVDSQSQLLQTEPNEEEAADDDEETIAIFATTAGQELALYRVDGSDEIYAVSLFDESGDPPTNFEYLMSSDVERLIKQGAVRTVKKPSRFKNQMAPMAVSQELHEQSRQLYGFRTSPKYKDTRPARAWEPSPNRNKYIKNSGGSVYSIVDKQPEVNYIMLDSLDQEEEVLEELESEEEVIQQSTVQYLLCDDEQSDTELSFDDIRGVLESKKDVTKTPPKMEQKKKSDEGANGVIPPKSVVHRHSIRPNIMQTHRKTAKSSTTDGKPNYLKDGNTAFTFMEDFGEAGKENTVASVPTEKMELKVKRPRKQNLTSVNRGDSEIIIQPASMIDEEEETPSRKRNKRKRKVLPDPDYNPRTPTKKIRKLRKHSRVEVIDIDLDEEDNRSPIEEITIDDGKEKNSSDKENNVIMVGDSDEDSQESNEKLNSPVLKCQFCSRNFRQRRLLDTHTRICPKARSKKSEKREFTCKTCEEKFDAALALARHVRVNHPRGRPRKVIHVATNDDEDDEDETPRPNTREKAQEKLAKDAEAKEARVTKVTRSSTKENKVAAQREKEKKPPKKKRIVKRVLKKVNMRKQMGIYCCKHCVKVSLSLGEARKHYLQHVTKSALKYCKICKAVAPSYVALLYHMKIHKKKKKSAKPAPKPKAKKETKEPVKVEEPPPAVVPRKRGRPRKVKPAD